MKFKNKVVWITGASTGIGEALAYAFSNKEARLILSSRNESELVRVKNNCKGEKNNISILPFDLEDIDTIPDIASKGMSTFGTIDMLINNGGISQRSLVKDTIIEVDERIMRINYLGQIALTKAILPHMLEKKSGHIVVISSIMGVMTTPLRSAYCASKHALHGFFDALRSEIWKDDISVTIVCPASIKTGISLNALTGDGQTHGKMDPQQAKGMSPEICAKKIINAVRKRREQVVIGPPVKYATLIKRFVPGIFSMIIRRAKVT
ncbi:MAG: SDR family oxidoreductase [Deltaproteobacteria bacterium]|nr:SDR family oxidoreductase [Deltaproteobacteria bacterium]